MKTVIYEMFASLPVVGLVRASCSGLKIPKCKVWSVSSLMGSMGRNRVCSARDLGELA